MYAYNHLTSPRNTSSGVADFFLMADVDAFEADGIKCPEAPFTAPGDSVIVKNPHVFKAGEGFIKVSLAPDKNKIAMATIGDKGFKKQDITLTAVIPGIYPVVMEYIKEIQNRPLLIIVKDSNCAEDQWYQLGCDCQSVYASPTGDTGTTADGYKGYTVEFNIKVETLLTYKPQELSGSPATITLINPISQLKVVA